MALAVVTQVSACDSTRIPAAHFRKVPGGEVVLQKVHVHSPFEQNLPHTAWSRWGGQEVRQWSILNFENKRLEAVQKDTIKLCTETNTQCIPSLIHQQHKLATVILCSFTALPTCFGSSLSGKLPSVDPWLSLCAIRTSKTFTKSL